MTATSLKPSLLKSPSAIVQSDLTASDFSPFQAAGNRVPAPFFCAVAAVENSAAQMAAVMSVLFMLYKQPSLVFVTRTGRIGRSMHPGDAGMPILLMHEWASCACMATHQGQLSIESHSSDVADTGRPLAVVLYINYRT